MISLKGVNKYFNKGKSNEIHVINNTTLELESTGIVAILGPSGCGKTTLLNAIGGLDHVESGSIEVNGKEITGKSSGKIDETRALNIGYIFQDYKLIDDMTVFQNVAMVLKMNGIKDQEEIKLRVEYVLEKLGIERYKYRLAGMLSGGERQRVGIARAIVKNPQIIIADEPTGNLDSTNTIEVMNIIKAISRDRLVVLVTHEVELAKFYATRVIELKDGVIVKDYDNSHDNSLNYRLDNRVYLRDFEEQNSLRDNDNEINIYHDSNTKVLLDIAVKNGNIYIKARDGARIEVVDSASAIEFVDDNYKEIDKSTYEEYNFEFDQVINKDIKEEYSSIISFGGSILAGFKKISSFSRIKKILLLGFLAAGMFITFAYSSLYASFDVKEENFIKTNKDYITVTASKPSIEAFEECKSLEGVDYVLPGDGSVTMGLDFDFYYQTNYAKGGLTGSLTDIAWLNEQDILYGRMPEKKYEVVLDKLSVERMISEMRTEQVGIKEAKDVVGLKGFIPGMKEFTVVGVTDKYGPAIYADRSLFTNMRYMSRNLVPDDLAYGRMTETPEEIFDYKLVENKITLKQGSYPKKKYEMIVPYEIKDEYPLGKSFNQNVGKNLKVVGYYESKQDMTKFLTNKATLEAIMILESKTFIVAPTDIELAKENIISGSDGLQAENSYEHDKAEYEKQIRNTVISNAIMALIILAISLLEILLMTRASFMSRIKEVGILRAIGVKKRDIYKMFTGEIIAVTGIGSVVGIGLMSYILYNMAKLSYISDSVAMNPMVVLLSVATVFIFNIVVGLIPVFNTIRNTPAEILSRYDVD